MNKEPKTASELEAMIMQQASERSDCAEVRSVAVTSGDLGWRVVTILRDGNMMITTPKAIEQIASELRVRYELAPAKNDETVPPVPPDSTVGHRRAGR